MRNVKTILLMGRPASGKTTVMRFVRDGIMEGYSMFKYGVLRYARKGSIYMLGVFDGSITEGTDRLSMGVLPTALDFIRHLEDSGERAVVLCEGDRLTNRTFIDKVQPTIHYISAGETLLRERMMRRNGEIVERLFIGRKHKIEHIAEEYGLVPQMNESGEDFSAIVNGIMEECTGWTK